MKIILIIFFILSIAAEASSGITFRMTKKDRWLKDTKKDYTAYVQYLKTNDLYELMSSEMEKKLMELGKKYNLDPDKILTIEQMEEEYARINIQLMENHASSRFTEFHLNKLRARLEQLRKDINASSPVGSDIVSYSRPLTEKELENFRK